MILNQITLDIEAVVALENCGREILCLHFDCSTQVGHQRTLAIGRNQRHALTRALLATQNEGLNAQIVQRRLEEVARRVATYFTDETDLATEARHSTNRIVGRAAEREGVGESRNRFRDLLLLLRINQAHTAARQIEFFENLVRAQVHQHIRQGISNADNFLHIGLYFLLIIRSKEFSVC